MKFSKEQIFLVNRPTASSLASSPSSPLPPFLPSDNGRDQSRQNIFPISGGRVVPREGEMQTLRFLAAANWEQGFQTGAIFPCKGVIQHR